MLGSKRTQYAPGTPAHVQNINAALRATSHGTAIEQQRAAALAAIAVYQLLDERLPKASPRVVRDA